MDVVFIGFAIYGIFVFRKWRKVAVKTDSMLDEMHDEINEGDMEYMPASKPCDHEFAPCEYATIRTNPLDDGEEAYYNTLEEAIEAFGITESIAPKWIPDRFEITNVWVTNQTSGVLICADYASGDGHLQIRFREKSSSNFSSLEQEGSDVEAHFKGEVKHYLLSDMDRQKAFWQNGQLECQVFGNVSRQEIKDIVDSIYEGD